MTPADILPTLLILLVMTIILTGAVFEKKTGVPAIPTLPWVRRKIIDAVKLRLDTDGKLAFAELGCGWGGINLALARNFPNSTVKGYEISLFPYIFSQLRAKLTSNRVQIVRKSFLLDDLTQFDVLICYLSRKMFENLQAQFAVLKPGTLIISNAFSIPGREPEEILHTNVFIRIPIYVYRI